MRCLSCTVLAGCCSTIKTLYHLLLQAVRRSPNFTSGDTVELAILNMVKKDIDDAAVPGSSTPAGGDGSSQGSFELATATHWPDVQQDNVLIAPHEARLAWREFISTSALSVQQVRPHTAAAS